MEIVLILYIGTCNFMPGGEVQKQLYYVSWMPFLILLSGQLLNTGVFVRNGHVLVLFKIYHNLFPSIQPGMEEQHHLFVFALILYLSRNTGKFKDWMVEKKKGELITESYLRKMDVETKYDYHSKVDPKLKAFYEFYQY